MTASLPLRESESVSEKEFICRQFKLEFRALFEELIVRASNAVPEDKTLDFWLRLPKVLGKMANPFYFADSVIALLNSPRASLEHKILSLNCLIILIGKFSFEFEDYYAKLFRILRDEYLHSMNEQPGAGLESLLTFDRGRSELFSNRFSSKFMKVLEVSFRSAELSFNVLASFVKVRAGER